MAPPLLLLFVDGGVGDTGLTGTYCGLIINCFVEKNNNNVTLLTGLGVANVGEGVISKKMKEN